MKLFRRILSATVLISLVIYRKNIGWKVNHQKFRLDKVEDLLVKYSVQCNMSGCHDGDNTVRRVIQHFPGKTLPQKRNIRQQDGV